MILGGIGLLYAATPEDDMAKRTALVTAADTIALGVVWSGSRWLSDSGCLVEPCERSSVRPHGSGGGQPEGCNADGTQFKGIFVRYLRYPGLPPLNGTI